MDTYKILGQVITDGDTSNDVVVYSPSSNTQASLSNITITNTSDSTQTYDLAFARNNELLNGYIDEIHSFIFVAAQGYGTVAISSDGVTWTEYPSPVIATSGGMTYGNGVFVNLNGHNKTLISPDGITWTEYSRPTSLPQSIIFGNGIFVSIDSQNKSFISTDGITWTQGTMPTANYWQSVTYGNGIFVAVASDGKSATSVDGINWTSENISSVGLAYFVIYANNMFVAVGVDTYAISSDGINWISGGMPSSTYWLSIAYGNGVFVAVGGGNTSAISTDGITWTLNTMAFDYYTTCRSIIYANSMFIAVAESNVCCTSPDGINWTAHPMPSWSYWNQIAYKESVQNSKRMSTDAQKVIISQSIESGKTHEINGGIGMQSGDELRINTSSPELIAHAYGVEIS